MVEFIHIDDHPTIIYKWDGQILRWMSPKAGEQPRSIKFGRKQFFSDLNSKQIIVFRSGIDTWLGK